MHLTVIPHAGGLYRTEKETHNLNKEAFPMNVPIINAPIEPILALVVEHIDLACAKAIKLFRGRVFDCRRCPGANASIA